MRSLGVSLQRNVLNTQEKQIGFTHWIAKFGQARSLKKVRCLQRQSRSASGTKEPETDTPQAEAHQSYRSREKGSTVSSSDSRKQRAKPKKTAEEKGGE
jgi:hypothetical protein